MAQYTDITAHIQNHTFRITIIRPSLRGRKVESSKTDREDAPIYLYLFNFGGMYNWKIKELSKLIGTYAGQEGGHLKIFLRRK